MHKGTFINDVPRFLAISDLPTLSYSMKSLFGAILQGVYLCLIFEILSFIIRIHKIFYDYVHFWPKNMIFRTHHRRDSIIDQTLDSR